jgi:hypothetical protein
MKRNLAAIFAVMASVVLASSMTLAQTSIVLGRANQTAHFVGLGSSNTVGFQFGFCRKDGVCKSSGTATGTGLLTSGPAPYSFTSTLNSITLTLLNAAAGTWSVSETAPILFSYGKGGSLLTGDLNLLNFVEAPGSKQGMFNYTASTNLVVTGGSLASIFASSHGVLDVMLKFDNGKNIQRLLGNFKTLGAHIGGGEVLTTPEPTSLLLLGSGLLVLGTFLRFRRRLRKLQLPT